MWQHRNPTDCCHIAGGYNEGFRAKFRPVHFNLKDEKNPDFRGKVLRGEVQPVDLLRMEPKDMASEVRLHQNLVMNHCCPYLAAQTHSPWVVLNRQLAVMQHWSAWAGLAADQHAGAYGALEGPAINPSVCNLNTWPLRSCLNMMPSKRTALSLYECPFSAYPDLPGVCIIAHQQFCRCAISGVGPQMCKHRFTMAYHHKGQSRCTKIIGYNAA